MSPKKKAKKSKSKPPRKADPKAEAAPAEEKGPEHRAFPRYGFDQPFPYRILKQLEKSEIERLEKAHQEALAKNISLGGLCIQVDEALSPGTVLEVMIPSALSEQSLPVEASVIWYETAGDTQMAGVAFQSLDQEASLSIQKMITEVG